MQTSTTTSPLPSERVTVVPDDDIVVFLIGARVNKWWRIWEWLPVVMAMPRMIRELEANPESGFLGSRGTNIQYWRSAEHLIRYARSRDAEHFPAWTNFYRRAAQSEAVGIWHETYIVPRSNIEAVYYATPRQGLAAIFDTVPATGRRGSARKRLEVAAENDASDEARLAS